MHPTINAIMFVAVFLTVMVCIESFKVSQEESGEKDRWVLKCMIATNRTSADCEVYYRVLKDYQDDKQP